MPVTYESIATTTLGSNQTSVTFNSFSGYTDLILVSNVQATSGSTGRWMKIKFNGDSGSNYSITYIQGNGTSAISDRYSSRNDGCFISLTNSSGLTPVITHIQNYANSTTYKTILSRSSSTSSDGVLAIVGLWQGTAAITSFTLDIETIANDLKAGSTFTLYGIKSA
jgi:hypothetical protein